MLGKSPDQQPTELFKSLLAHQLNSKHPLYLLSHAIAWKKLEEEVLAPSVGRHGVQLDAASQGISRSFFAMLCWVIWGQDFPNKLPYLQSNVDADRGC